MLGTVVAVLVGFCIGRTVKDHNEREKKEAERKKQRKSSSKNKKNSKKK